MATDPSSNRSRQKADGSALDTIEFICIFLVVFSGYLWFARPASTTAAVVFRVSLLVSGTAGFVLLRIRRLRKGRT